MSSKQTGRKTEHHPQPLSATARGPRRLPAPQAAEARVPTSVSYAAGRPALKAPLPGGLGTADRAAVLPAPPGRRRWGARLTPPTADRPPRGRGAPRRLRGEVGAGTRRGASRRRRRAPVGPLQTTVAHRSTHPAPDELSRESLPQSRCRPGHPPPQATEAPTLTTPPPPPPPPPPLPSPPLPSRLTRRPRPTDVSREPGRGGAGCRARARRAPRRVHWPGRRARPRGGRRPERMRPAGVGVAPAGSSLPPCCSGRGLAARGACPAPPLAHLSVRPLRGGCAAAAAVTAGEAAGGSSGGGPAPFWGPPSRGCAYEAEAEPPQGVWARRGRAPRAMP